MRGEDVGKHLEALARFHDWAAHGAVAWTLERIDRSGTVVRDRDALHCALAAEQVRTDVAHAPSGDELFGVVGVTHGAITARQNSLGSVNTTHHLPRATPTITPRHLLSIPIGAPVVNRFVPGRPARGRRRPGLLERPVMEVAPTQADRKHPTRGTG